MSEEIKGAQVGSKAQNLYTPISIRILTNFKLPLFLLPAGRKSALKKALFCKIFAGFKGSTVEGFVENSITFLIVDNGAQASFKDMAKDYVH